MLASFLEEGGDPRTARRRGVLLAAAAAALVYVNAVALGFAYDDVLVIHDNEALHSWPAIVDGLTAPYWPGNYGEEVGVWRPVVSAWWGVQWLAWGDTPALFHVVGVLLHAGVCALLVVVLYELLSVPAAVLGGLVFAVHPVHVEAVANVVGNAELIAALFMLGACLLHLRASGRYGWGRSAAVGALFVLGALSKEIAYTLPAVLFLLDAARCDVGFRELPGYLKARWRPYAVIVAAFLALLVARRAILGGVAPPQAPFGASLLGEVSRIWTVPAVWTHYVRLLLFPLDLNADYGGIVPVLIGWGPVNLTGAFAAIACLLLALWGWRTGGALEPAHPSRRVLGLAVVWFGVTILPAANVLFLSPVLVAERNLYIPSIGMAAAAGWLLHELFRHRRAAAPLVTAALLVLMAARTFTRTPYWNDTRLVFADLLERHPEAPRGWFYYADGLFRAQHPQPELRRVLAVLLLVSDSEYAVATQVGGWLSTMDKASPRAAEFLLERAWRDRPQYYTAPGLLAVHHLNHRTFARGEAAGRAALAMAPENPDMHRIVAGLISGQGRAAEAIPFRLAAIARGGRESFPNWFFLASDYLTAGDTAAARAALDSARVRAPSPEALAPLEERLSGAAGAAPEAAAHVPTTRETKR